MADVSVIFFLSGLALAVTVINALLKQAGREEYSYLVLLCGLILALLKVLPLVTSLFQEVQSVFSLY
jgi:stage III sporulation protein AC